MKEGTLFYNDASGRFDILFAGGRAYGGLHCGDCLDAKIGGEWAPTRIEYGDDWYLVRTGLRGGSLCGLQVRM
jgi:hypothetical protein